MCLQKPQPRSYCPGPVTPTKDFYRPLPLPPSPSYSSREGAFTAVLPPCSPEAFSSSSSAPHDQTGVSGVGEGRGRRGLSVIARRKQSWNRAARLVRSRGRAEEASVSISTQTPGEQVFGSSFRKKEKLVSSRKLLLLFIMLLFRRRFPTRQGHHCWPVGQ